MHRQHQAALLGAIGQHLGARFLGNLGVFAVFAVPCRIGDLDRLGRATRRIVGVARSA